jgi:hypothetical protein
MAAPTSADSREEGYIAHVWFQSLVANLLHRDEVGPKWALWNIARAVAPSCISVRVERGKDTSVTFDPARKQARPL